MDKKIALSHIEKSRLLRQRLRTKKIQENAEKNFNDDNNQNNNEHSLNENIPLKTCKSSPITCNTSIKLENEKKDPLNFFNSPNNENKDYTDNDTNNDLKLNQTQDIRDSNIEEIKNDELAKKESKKILKKNSDSSSSSSSSSDDEEFEKKEEQRLLNKKFAQDKLFKNNKIFPSNKLFKPKNKEPEITKDIILEKLGLDFDKATELLELNEEKKQIMLKKMKRTLTRLSHIRIGYADPEEDEKKYLIKKKVDEIKKLYGDKYENIKEKVENVIMNLKLPEYFFDADEDVNIIHDNDNNDKDKEEFVNIINISDEEFCSAMKD